MARTWMPPKATGHETAAHLQGTVFAKQFVMDPVPFVVWDLPSVQATGPLALISDGAGTAALTEMGSSEICGFLLNASTEAYGSLWGIPAGTDMTKDIGFRAIWSESGTGGSGNAQFAVKYTELAFGTGVAIGATALGTVIATDTPSTTADALQGSPWGLLAGLTLTSDPGEVSLALTTIVTLTTITDATIYRLEGYRSRLAL